MYQLLSWTNGSFAKARLDTLEQQIKARHVAIGAQLATLRATATGAERTLVDAAIMALAGYRKAVLETMEMAQMDQSIATNSMLKAETQFVQLNTQLAQLSALETTLSSEAHATASAVRSLDGLAADVAAVSRFHRRDQWYARHAGGHPRHCRRSENLAAVKLNAGAPSSSTTNRRHVARLDQTTPPDRPCAPS